MSGIITGQSVLVDRLPYGNATKIAAVSEQSLKDHIELTHSLDDAIVTGVGGYMFAAMAEAEKRGNVSLISQSRIQIIGEELLARLSGSSVALSNGPVINVTAVKYLDEDGEEQDLPIANYRVTPRSSAVYFFGTLPTLTEGPETVWIEYEAGFGDTSDAVPADWQNIVMTLAMRKYEYRGADSGSSNDSWERMMKQMVLIAAGGFRA